MPLFLPTPRGTDAAKSTTDAAKSSAQNRHFPMQRTTGGWRLFYAGCTRLGLIFSRRTILPFTYSLDWEAP
jgi:hypothetical protein